MNKIIGFFKKIGQIFSDSLTTPPSYSYFCPKCGTKYACPCKSCVKYLNDVKTAWIANPDDTETCPKCGLTQHLDGWFNTFIEQEKSA